MIRGIERSASVARKRAKRVDKSVKIDAEVAHLAHIVASYRKVSLAEYLSDLLAPLVRADHEAEVRRHAPGLLPDDLSEECREDEDRPPGPPEGRPGKRK